MHTIIVDLGFGDAGKGTMVDWLCRSEGYQWVARFSGGAQAAHNVVLPDGTHHTFAQFGSGTFAGAGTYLSQYMLVNLLALEREAKALTALGVNDVWDRLRVHREALLITPYHIAYNHELERRRGLNRHGSCGQGIGTTQSYALEHPEDALRIGDLFSSEGARKLECLSRWLRDDLGLVIKDEANILGDYERIVYKIAVVHQQWFDYMLDHHDVIFEGSQGVLLDEDYGFHPHTTWSRTTPANAKTLLGDREHQVLGVVRSYCVRHGPGPMPTENKERAKVRPEPHNVWGEHMGAFRVGDFDGPATRYAIEVSGGIDGLIVTHADYDTCYLRTSYAYAGRTFDRISVASQHDDFRERSIMTRMLSSCVGTGDLPATPEMIAKWLEVPLYAVSYGPTWENKTYWPL